MTLNLLNKISNSYHAHDKLPVEQSTKLTTLIDYSHFSQHLFVIYIIMVVS